MLCLADNNKLLSTLQEPLPGPNAFVNAGRILASYPKRAKYSATAANVPIHAQQNSAYENPGAPGQSASRNTTPIPAGRGPAPTGNPAGVRGVPPGHPSGLPRKRKMDQLGPGFR
jgi:hypothetical protein